LRKSIALFITLLFLLAVIVVLNKILNTKTTSFGKIISENSLIVKNTLDTLKEIKKNINKSDDLDNIFTTFPLSNNDGTFRAVINIKPVFDKIDINALLQKGKINPYIENYLENILSYYKIEDPEYLKDLILDTIDTDLEEREAYSEIANENPYFQNGKIYGVDQLNAINRTYFKKTDDKNVFQIPWEEYFYFGDGKIHMLDCERMDTQTAKFLSLNVEEQTDCETISTKENNETIKNLNIIPYDKNQSYWVEVNINYIFDDVNSTLKITYDLNNKKVINIESNPVY